MKLKRESPFGREREEMEGGIKERRRNVGKEDISLVQVYLLNVSAAIIG